MYKNMEKDGYGYEDDNMRKAGMPSETTSLTPEKAKTMLKEGEVGGDPLTQKQEKFFGVVAGKDK